MSLPSGFRRSAIAIALALCSGAGLLFAQEQSATTISHQVRDVFERAAKAIVKIHGVDEHSEICGTGFFVDPTGTLYTAYTVGGEAGRFTVEFDGKKYPARQLLADIRSGTALLKVDQTTPALAIGKSDELQVATPVVSIGYPLDLPKTPNFGMIAGFDRKCLGRYFSTIHLRVNAPTQRGEDEVDGVALGGVGRAGERGADVLRGRLLARGRQVTDGQLVLELTLDDLRRGVLVVRGARGTGSDEEHRRRAQSAKQGAYHDTTVAVWRALGSVRLALTPSIVKMARLSWPRLEQ
jgi:hypothetical protein